jgi:DNA polymerase I-like protein with 3'-5' exonuclease and polymerase domains
MSCGICLVRSTIPCKQLRLTLGETRTSLAKATKAYLELDLDKDNQKSDWSAENLSKEQLNYAALDAVALHKLAQPLVQDLKTQRSAYDIQVAAVPAAMRMQRRGFLLDEARHAKLVEEYTQERAKAAQVYVQAATAMGLSDIAVPKTPKAKEALLEAILTSEELLRWQRTPKARALSTKGSELRRAQHYPPIAALVKVHKFDKCLSSFGQSLTQFVSPVTGRVHANYRVAATASGRASCAKPNLQQIPRDPRFRALFRAREGYVLVLAGYSSMELRAAAHIAEDRAMTEAFEKGWDLHCLTASLITGKNDLEAVTDEERKGAKAANFGTLFGQGAKGLKESAWDNYNLPLTLEEAAQLQKAVKARFPRVVRWREDHFWLCERRGKIIIGKDMKRGIGREFPYTRLPRDKKSGQRVSAYTRCCNLPIQGACADASTIALTFVDQRLAEAGIKGGPVAWLHDEIVLEVPIADAPKAKEILERAMVEAFEEIFPGAPTNGLVKAHTGQSWAEAKAGKGKAKSIVH